MGPITARLLPIVAAIGLVFTLWHQYRLYNFTSVERLLSASSSLPESSIHSDGSIGTANQKTIYRRVVAVADLHGDLQHAHNVLRMAGLIDNDYVPNWIGGHDVLVSTGDIVDRGDDTIELYTMFQRLRKQASDAGGGVYNCVSV